MSNLDLLNTWIRYFEDVQKIEEYEDLTQEFNSLRIKVESKREITDENNKKFENIIKINWQRVLKNICDGLENKIVNRKTEGQNFTGNLRDIRRIKRRSEEYLDMDEYYELYNDLKEVREDTDVKLSIEKSQKRESRKMLVFAFFLGVLSTLIGGIALAYYFNYFPVT